MTQWAASIIDRPVGVMMVVIAIVVFGWISMTQLPVNLMPDVSFPTITVRGNYDGAAPLEVEREIIEPLEQVLRTVEGVKDVESISRPGYGEIYLRFHWGTNLDVATQRVRERIALAPLREGISPPRILRYDPALDPVFRLALSGRSSERLGQYARSELVPALSSSPGVALARVRGDGRTVIMVAIQPERLARYGLDMDRVHERLASENLSLVGGRLKDHGREILIRIDSEIRSLDALGQLVLITHDQVPIRLRDVATIQKQVIPPDALTTWNGQPSVEIDIYREADANMVAVVDGLRARLFEGNTAWTKTLPPGIHLDVSEDASHTVRAAISEVQNNAIMGALYAVIVLFLFLRAVYPTLVISLAIPLSVIAVFAPLRWAGITLNIMSLGGLALGVGMVVDNAVVVLEAIYRRTEQGESARDAALAGTKEVGGAVIASTMTTVAVFAPIVFMEGIASLFFRDLGVTVALALLASLAFSLFFVPTLLALRGRVVPHTGGTTETTDENARTWWSWQQFKNDNAWWQQRCETLRGWTKWLAWIVTPFLVGYWIVRTAIAVVFESIWRAILKPILSWSMVTGRWIGARLQRAKTDPSSTDNSPWMHRYHGMIRWVLSHAWIVGVAVACLFIGATWAWHTLGVELVPKQQQNTFFVQLAMPSSTPMEDVAARTVAIERQLTAMQDVAATASSVGESDDNQNQPMTASNIGRIRVQIASGKKPAQTHDRVIAHIETLLSQEPGITWTFDEERLVATPPAIRVEIIGSELNDLRTAAAQITTTLEEMDGIADVQNRQQRGKDELVVRLDAHRLAAFGLNAHDVATQLRMMTRGERGGTIRLDGDRLDVRLQAANVDGLRALQELEIPLPTTPFGEAQRSTAGASIAGMALDDVLQSSASRQTVQDRFVRLRSLADFDVQVGPSEIRHLRGRRIAIVEADATIRDVQGLNERVVERLDRLSLPEGVDVRLAGQRGDIRDASGSLLFAFALAVFLVYAVMASLFESLIGPLLIMVTVPLAVAAVLIALMLSGFPISVLVLIGLIVLVGIVVNNAIVLVDTMLQLERGGMPRDDAIVQASGMRLRPVLITAMTTVLGLLPMLFASGEGAEIRQPIALVLVVGLSVSTLLTLVVIPVLYQKWMPTLRVRVSER